MSNSGSKSVLFVVYQLAAKGNGGVQSITNIITELSPFHKVIVLTQSTTNFNDVWAKAGAEVIVKEESRGGLLNIIFRNIYVFFLLKKINVSTVHCNDIQSLMTSFFGVKLSFKKLIFNKRGVKPENDKYPVSWNIILWFVDHVIVLSKDMMDRVVTHFPALKHKISYSYSIVDFNRFRPKLKTEIRNQLEVPVDKIVFGIVARFEPLKQQLRFIKETVSLLPEEVKSKAMFYMIGDFDPINNNYSRACKELVLINQLERIVKLLPFTPAVEDWYNVFDYTLVVSTREGLSRSMIESLSCGTPVLSFDISSAKEIIEERSCGLVIPRNNFKLLRNEIIQLVQSKKEYKGIKDVSINQAKELFSVEKVVKEYIRFYN